MGISFKADEIFEFAVEIEKNAAQFYRRAAELNEAAGEYDFLVKLAEMEDDHVKTFSAMRESLGGSAVGATGFDPDGEVDLFLQAMADSHGGEGDPAATKQLTGEESLADILKTGVRMEKDTILFYREIVDNVPPEYGREKVEKIIEEEKDHLVTLTRKLKQVK